MRRFGPMPARCVAHSPKRAPLSAAGPLSLSLPLSIRSPWNAAAVPQVQAGFPNRVSIGESDRQPIASAYGLC